MNLRRNFWNTSSSLRRADLRGEPARNPWHSCWGVIFSAEGLHRNGSYNGESGSRQAAKRGKGCQCHENAVTCVETGRFGSSIERSQCDPRLHSTSAESSPASSDKVSWAIAIHATAYVHDDSDVSTQSGAFLVLMGSLSFTFSASPSQCFHSSVLPSAHRSRTR